MRMCRLWASACSAEVISSLDFSPENASSTRVMMLLVSGVDAGGCGGVGPAGERADGAAAQAAGRGLAARAPADLVGVPGRVERAEEAVGRPGGDPLEFGHVLQEGGVIRGELAVAHAAGRVGDVEV